MGGATGGWLMAPHVDAVGKGTVQQVLLNTMFWDVPYDCSNEGSRFEVPTHLPRLLVD